MFKYKHYNTWFSLNQALISTHRSGKNCLQVFIYDLRIKWKHFTKQQARNDTICKHSAHNCKNHALIFALKIVIRTRANNCTQYSEVYPVPTTIPTLSYNSTCMNSIKLTILTIVHFWVLCTVICTSSIEHRTSWSNKTL